MECSGKEFIPIKSGKIESSGKEEIETNKKDDNVIVKFISSDKKVYELSKAKLSYSPFLATLINNNFEPRKIDDAFIIDKTSEELEPIMIYLSSGIVQNIDLEQLEYFGIPYPDPSVHSEFFDIQLRERWQRRFTIDKPRVDKVILREVLQKNLIPLSTVSYAENLVIHSKLRYFELNPGFLSAAKKNQRIKLDISGIDITKYGGKIVLAGGSLTSHLLSQKVHDYDFFFVDCEKEDAIEIIQDILIHYEKNNPDKCFANVRWYCTKNAWTVTLGQWKFQFIFRMYKNIDEILLGFDIDACCIVYDGKEIYISKRCLHALTHHVNIFDFERMSPSYEHRLWKYSTRGFDVFVPRFDPKKVKLSGKEYPANNLRVHLRNNGETLIWLYEYNSKLSSSKSRRYRRRNSRIWVPSNIYHHTQTSDSSDDSDSGESGSDSDSESDSEGVTRKSESKSEVDSGKTEKDDVIALPSSFSELDNPKKSNLGSPNLVLKGIDVLLFFGNNVHGKAFYSKHVCDYGEYYLPSQTLQKGFLNDTRGTGRHRNTKGEFTCIPKKFLSFKHNYKFLNKDTISQLLILLNNREVEPQWIEKNSGQQITSSFHSLILEDIEKYYYGIYYNDEKVEMKIEEQVVNLTI